jgi:hypothetical protein
MRAWLVGASLLLLAGCGTSTTAGPEPSPSVADGELQTRDAITVLDDGDGPELCLGGVALSLPPQCGGPALPTWDWEDHAGDFEDVGGVRWGEFHVVGTFDGETFTPSQVTPVEEFDAPEDETDQFVTTCEEPAGGWVVDPSLVEFGDENAAFRAADRLPDYGGAFLDTSRDPRPGEEIDQALVDGETVDISTWIVNVRVTDDPARAEVAIREVWGGGLCITTAAHTQAELRRVQGQLDDVPGFLSSGVGDDTVELGVVYDDGSIQAGLDEEYGDGLVRVSSALVPAAD